ncbi:MAG: flagellar basal body rod C-terminal domain-containing protein [Phycisphaerae bacterium]|nr:flagellar basal body rod C-terminal domain-containing protein [Phycisphaerae bacterium]
MHGALDISTSALVANRIRLDAIAANLAAVDIPGNPNGPVRPPATRDAIFAVGDPVSGAETGVHVADIQLTNAWVPRNQPGHHLADKDGNVWYADINPVEQQANMMMAARSYEANIAAIEARKSMISSALELLA